MRTVILHQTVHSKLKIQLWRGKWLGLSFFASDPSSRFNQLLQARGRLLNLTGDRFGLCFDAVLTLSVYPLSGNQDYSYFYRFAFRNGRKFAQAFPILSNHRPFPNYGNSELVIGSRVPPSAPTVPPRTVSSASRA